MKIREIIIKDYAWFKDLHITGLPDEAKLVMLIGPNGCGKTSLFTHIKDNYQSENRPYWSDSRDKKKVIFDKRPDEKSVYIRTAYRNSPSFRAGKLSNDDFYLGKTEDRINSMSDNNSVVDKNCRYMTLSILYDILEKQPGEMTLNEFRKLIIREINNALKELFPDLTVKKILPFPYGSFLFEKNEKHHFYTLSASGEKAAFDLIFDLIVKRKEYNDTVFCIDEPEVHISPRIQGKLLRVLYDLVPDNCQLWIATHSIGMMREAYDMQKEQPDKVVFLDFGGRDFDQPQTIKSEKMTRNLWEKIHKIVLGDLADLVAPDILCICESTPEKQFDAACYETIFAAEYPLAQFVSVGSGNEVKRLSALLPKAMPKLRVIAIRDGDTMTEKGKEEARTKGVRVLSRHCIESYLTDGEVLKAFCEEHFNGDESILGELENIKNECANKDIKKAPQEILARIIKKNKNLTIGDNAEDFQKNTLSPLIKPGMNTYAELKQDIFGEIV